MAAIASVRSCVNDVAVEIADVPRALRAQQLRLLGAAHDVDEADPVLRGTGGSASGRDSTPPRCARARCGPRSRIVSTMPSAVSGLTKQEAPSAGGRCPAAAPGTAPPSTQRCCEYIAPPKAATVLPSSACAAADAPAAITTPAPSLPTGMDTSTRAAIAFISPSGILAVTTGRASVPEPRAVSCPPRRTAARGRTDSAARPRRGSGPRPARLAAPAPRQATARVRRSP